MLDGLVAEGDLGAARYAVVDGGGLLTHHRFLLPLSLIRFDERERLLRVDINKDVATHYPPFDRDEFQTMSDDDRRGYERRLLKFFPRDYRDHTAALHQTPALPEWLVTGTWITVSPERVRDLPNEARSFVNEFAPAPGARGESPREHMVAHEFEPPPPPPESIDKLR